RRAFDAGIIAFGAVFVACALSQRADAQQCPSFAHLDRVEQRGNVRTVHCKCNEGYAARDGSCQSAKTVAPPAVAHPHAARLSTAQLDLVDRRIANLQRSIALLSDENPEWARERDQVLDDMDEDLTDLSFEGLNLVTLGLARWAKVAAKLHVADMRSAALL